MVKNSSVGRADVRDMLVVHEAFRQNYSRLPTLVRGVKQGDARRAKVIADHITLIQEFLHLHHTGEDDLLWPKLYDRAGDDLAETVKLLETHHEEISLQMAEIDSAKEQWRTNPSAPHDERLAKALEELCEALSDHLAIEEKEVLTIVPDHISAPEWHALADHSITKLPKKKLPIVFGMLASLAEPEVVTLMLSTAPPVPRRVMPLLGPRLYKGYSKNLYKGTSVAATA